MFNVIKSKSVSLALVLMLALASLPAFAGGGGGGGVDVSAVVSAIGAASTPIASIGAAVLLVLVGIKVYKWVRRAM